MVLSTSIPASTPHADPAWWVLCLCAAWCRTCDAYRDVFEAAQRAYPHMRFVWVDVEDEADLVGDIDVETFPTVLIADESGARFMGPLLPQEGVLMRMLASLQGSAAGQGSVDPQAQALFERIRAAKA